MMLSAIVPEDGSMNDAWQGEAWPALDYEYWAATAAALHRWSQILGKVRLAFTPWHNHSWHVPLYVTESGLSTSQIYAHDLAFQLELDLVRHRCVTRVPGRERHFALKAMSVASFYTELMADLREEGIDASIVRMPNEIPDPVPFDVDQVARPYDAEAARRFLRALHSIDRQFKWFRTGFLGKSSPVHFFWGSFDLAVTRFSGRRAPPHPGGIPGLPDEVTREAYSHEEASAGFWPGDDRYPKAAFYAYAYPSPDGIRDHTIEPPAARFNPLLGEMILDYEHVRTAVDPAAMLMTFLHSSFDAFAKRGGWDRSLDCPLGEPSRPRTVPQAESREMEPKSRRRRSPNDAK
jgi:hypothetical protein